MKNLILAALLAFVSLSAVAQTETTDTRPFKLCTDFDQVRYGNEFIIAYPHFDTKTEITTMYVLSQEYGKTNSQQYDSNIPLALEWDESYSLMVPYIPEAEILTLQKGTGNENYYLELSRKDESGNILRLSPVLDAEKTWMSMQCTTSTSYIAFVNINSENHTTNTRFIPTNGGIDAINSSFTTIYFNKDRGSLVFSCDKPERNSTDKHEPYFYFRPRLDLEYFSCDLPDADDIWSLTEYDETVFYTFDNPYYVDNIDEITWNVVLTDAVLGEQLFEGTGTSMELSIALPGNYDITVNDGIANYHKTLTVNPDPERHFTTINYLNKPHFADGYKIPNYTEGYNYYYKYDSLISDTPEQTESRQAKAPALDGFTAYDHSTGIPEPATSYGILTLAVERNGVSATHEILYSEVSGVADPAVGEAAGERFFDLSGRPLPQAPAKGMYIRVAGSKVEKVSAAN